VKKDQKSLAFNKIRKVGHEPYVVEQSTSDAVNGSKDRKGSISKLSKALIASFKNKILPMNITDEESVDESFIDIAIKDLIRPNKDLYLPKAKHPLLITLHEFKIVSKQRFENGEFEKLGHARESMSRELGFDCYRAYKITFEKKYQRLLMHVSELIVDHKKNYKPDPLAIIIDTNSSYIELLKESLKSDFDYFQHYNREELFNIGEDFSKVNVYDIFTESEFNEFRRSVKQMIRAKYLTEDGLDVLYRKNFRLPHSVPFENIRRLFKNSEEINERSFKFSEKTIVDEEELFKICDSFSLDCKSLEDFNFKIFCNAVSNNFKDYTMRTPFSIFHLVSSIRLRDDELIIEVDERVPLNFI